MDDETAGPSIEDYVRSVKRSLRGLVVSAVIAAALLALLSALSGGVTARYRAVVELNTIDERSVAQSFGLASDLVVTRTVGQEAVRLREVLRRAAKSSLPKGAVVAVSANEASSVITISAVADDADDAAKAADVAASQVVTARRSEVTARLKIVDDYQTMRLADLRDRLASIDAALATVTGDAQQRAFELDRITVLNEQLVAERTSVGVKLLLTSTKGGITDPSSVSAPKSEPNLGWVRTAVLGLILGALVAVAWIVVRTFLDRRLRSKAAIEKTVPRSAFVGVVPTGLGARSVAFDALIHRLGAHPHGSEQRIVVAGADRASVAQGARAELERAGQSSGLSLTLVDAGANIGRDGSLMTALAPGDRVVLVASYGKTSEDDLAASVSSVESSQAELAAVMLVDVPPGDLGTALRGHAPARSA